MEEVFITKEPILLGQFIKFIGLITNGGEAKMFLAENDVFVNNIKESRRGKKLFGGDFVKINNKNYSIVLVK